MVEYILVVMLFSQQPAVSFQEFKTKKTCEDAKTLLLQQNYLKPLNVACMPK
jgi:hypothetical protein